MQILRTSSLVAAGLLFAAVQAAVPAAADAAVPEPIEASPEVPFVLSIRGGVSLGAYESGLNWALLHFMKQRAESPPGENRGHITLEAASGASAGSINAVLSSISWCIDDAHAAVGGDYANTVDENVLRQTWLGIGFEELLPPGTASLVQYRRDDGVLTRNAFRETIERMERTLSSDDFRPGCEVPVAITVTRIEPMERVIAGVAVQNQRFVIPLTFRADATGRVRILSCLMDSADPAWGNVVYMQGTPTGDPACPLAHSAADLVDAIEASSAFPIAFGRKYLAYCMARADARGRAPRQRGSCPEDFVPLFDDFIDGGLFDNIPLGAAKALAEPTRNSRRQRARWEAAGRRFNYIYLDPTIRRSVLHRPGYAPDEDAGQAYALDDAGKSPTFGLRSQLFSFLGGAVRSGRDYELYSMLRQGDWTNQVYALAVQLQAAVRDRSDETAGAGAAAAEGTEEEDCSRWFESQPATTAAGDSHRVQRAMACIASLVDRLEQQYAGVAAGGRLLGSGGVTALREECLRWIATLAAWIDEPDVEWAAEQARYDKLGDRRILMSSRYSPVVGEMMAAFGGFVDRDFRDYDYFAGVYDAAWSIASFVCTGQRGRRDCVAHRMRNAYDELGIAGHSKANAVFLYLTRQEFAGDPGWTERYAWVEQQVATPQDRNMLAIARSLFAGHGSSEGLYVVAPDMTAFITRLVAEDYDYSGSSEFLQRIFRLQDSDEFTWYYPLSLRASNRLLYLEKRESEVQGGGELYQAALALGAFGLHSYMKEEEVTLNVSSAPDFSWQSWLPDEIAVNARSGGLDLSWYQGLPFGYRGWRWDFKLTPVQLNHSSTSRDDNVWFSQVDFLVSYKKHGIFSAVGLGPTVSWAWENWPDSMQLNYGGAIFIGLVEDKIRLTFGRMSFSDSFEGDDYYFNIGVNDFPGLIYWAFPDWRGSWLPEKVR